MYVSFAPRTTVAFDRSQQSRLKVISAGRNRYASFVLGRGMLRFALTAAELMVLALGCSAFAPAEQATDSAANPKPAAQSAPDPSAQSQTSDASTKQTPTPAPVSSKQRKLNCQHPADPTKRRFGCKDEDFHWEETLTSDWNGARTESRKLGITPTGSYYSALQTNTSGGPHQIWGYTGQLTTALDFNFEKLLKIPGMSLYVSNTWGTGSNLTATIDSVFPVNPNYAVGAHLKRYIFSKSSSRTA